MQGRIDVFSGTEQQLTLTGLADATGVPIENATVLGTMFDPTGAEVPGFQDVTLAHVSVGGNYAYVIPASFQVPTVPGFTVKITASVGGVLKLTLPILVITPSPIDLTTVAQVKAWVNAIQDTDNDNIQGCITALSQEFMRRTGRGTPDDTTVGSPFVSPQPFNEWYDGPGGFRLFLRNSPIQSVTQVSINGVTLPQSSDHVVPGWVIDANKKSLAIVGGVRSAALGRGAYTLSPGSIALRTAVGFTFQGGISNINVQYVAGFKGVPFEIEFAMRKWAALNYKRRDWIGQRSQSLAGGMGTTTYLDVEMTDDIQNVIFNYKRLNFN